MALGDDDEDDPDVLFTEHEVSDDRSRLHLRAWKVRRSQLPSIHSTGDGTTKKIDIGALEGIAEATDLIFFVGTSVCGQVVNRPAASRGDILRFIEDRTGVALELVNLTREEAVDLVRGDRVTNVSFEVATGHMEALADLNDNLSKAVSAVASPGFSKVRITISAGEAEERNHFWQFWRPKMTELTGHRDTVSGLQVGQAAVSELRATMIDLLDQQIGLEMSLPIQAGNTIERDAAAGAVRDAFMTHSELIAKAVDRMNLAAENQRTARRNAAAKTNPTKKSSAKE